MTTQPDTVFDSNEGGACESIVGSGGNVCVAYWEGPRREPTFITMVDEEEFMEQAIHGLGPYGYEQRTSSLVCTKGNKAVKQHSEKKIKLKIGIQQVQI